MKTKFAVFLFLGFILSGIKANAEMKIQLPGTTVTPVTTAFEENGVVMSLTLEDTGWSQTLRLYDSSNPDMKPHGESTKTYKITLTILDESSEPIDLNKDQKFALGLVAETACEKISALVHDHYSQGLAEVNTGKKVGLTIVKHIAKLQLFNTDMITDQIRANCHLEFKTEMK